jgi:hypothetical protein
MNAMSPNKAHSIHSGGSPLIGQRPAAEAIIAPGEFEQLLLRVRKPALGGDSAEPVGQFAVLLPGMG